MLERTSEAARLAAACLLVLGFALAGCTRRETPVETGIRDQVLHRGNLSEPKDLDPHIVTGVSEHNILAALLEGLVTENPESLAPAPGVAESWIVSDDGLQYTFQLRPDAKWSNGDSVTAADFVFSYRRVLSAGLGSPYAYMLYCLKNAKAYHQGAIADFSDVGVTARDPHTLEIMLEGPVPYFLSLLSHFTWYPVHPPTILQHGNIDQLGTKWTRPGSFVGNGPFALQAWEPGNRIVVAKNETYWDSDHVRLREIHFYPIGDHQIEERTFRAGQLHITGTVPIDRVAHYRTNRPDVLRVVPYLGCYYYLFNVGRPPLDDVRVRRALAMAIDRTQIVRSVTRGGEDEAYSFTPPGTAGYSCDARLPNDPGQARRLLTEAGYPGGEGFPRLELLYNTSDAHSRIAQAVQQMWKTNLHIDVELVNMEWKVYLAQTIERKYDIARAGWIGDYVDPNTFLDLWVTGAGNNRTGWSNPKYDRLIEMASQTADDTTRFEAFRQAETILLQEAPIVPIYFYRSKSLVHPAVRGWYPNILDRHPYKGVYLEAAE